MGYNDSATTGGAEQSSDNSSNANQQGPPPSYEAVVAMDYASGVQHPNIKKSSLTVSNQCPLYDQNDIKHRHHQHHHQHHDSDDCAAAADDGIDCKYDHNTSDEESMLIHREQTLSVCDMNRRESLLQQQNCCCEHILSINHQYDVVVNKLCKQCGRKMQTNNNNNDDNNSNLNGKPDNNVDYCVCYDLCTQNNNNVDSSNNINVVVNNDDQCNNNDDICTTTTTTTNLTLKSNTNDNNNLPSTSSQSNTNRYNRQHCENCKNNNNNNNLSDTKNNDKKNIVIDFETLNENGLIRLDMSQIIDHTGLPTYEAALKLESSGYV